MIMSINILEKDFATFQPQGYLSAANAGDFLQQLTEVVTSSTKSSLLVDMQEVEFIDSAGLMALIKGFHLARDLDCVLSICSVAPSVRMIFELTQLDKVFDIFDNQDTFKETIKVS